MTDMDGFMKIAQGKRDLGIRAGMANRHGLIAGATGTGKTVSLQVIAERCSAAGVPVFLADVKGDVSGIAAPGRESPKLKERLARLGFQTPEFRGFPVVFWDLYGRQGHPVRTTVSEMGPLLLSRLLGLNETQEGVLSIVFRVADDEGLLLLDLKDLRAMLQHVAENAKDYTLKYGTVSSVSVGAIQRGLLTLEDQGGGHFFGEPALDIRDFIAVDPSGQGRINVLAADRLIEAPKLYSTFLLWLLSELFEELPEAGDVDKPKLVFFFDEAHLLFDEAPKALLDKIEQVVRLVRSKGVGVYFISQNPRDIPDTVLGQLGNRIQHALRAFTPRDQKAIKTAAETFRQNPALSAEAAITELGTGEALVSFLDDHGRPEMVERAWICPPASRIGPLSPEERAELFAASPLRGRYDRPLDRESAYEILVARRERAAREAAEAGVPVRGRGAAQPRQTASRARGSGRSRQDPTEKLINSVVRSAGSTFGRQIGRTLVRGLLGNLFK